MTHHNPKPINGKTKVFGCIAHPTDHVRAPSLFNPIFAEKGSDAVMVPIDILPEKLEDAVNGLRAMPNFIGAAVTIPHKMALAELCDELGEVARITGAVNAIRIEDGRLKGDNFDGAGFVMGLYEQGHMLQDKKCLIIGAGGAARAIAYALCLEPISSLDVFNRTPDKAHDLVAAVKKQNSNANLEQVDELSVGHYDVVINSTSLGLYDGDALPCNVDELSASALVCDIIMVPAETALLKAASSRGIACHYGRHMFDNQLPLIQKFIGADNI